MNIREAIAVGERVRAVLLREAEVEVEAARLKHGTLMLADAIVELLRLAPGVTMVEFLGPQEPGQGPTVTLLVAGDIGSPGVLYRDDEWFRTDGQWSDPHNLHDDLMDFVVDPLSGALEDGVEFPTGPDGTYQFLIPRLDDN